MVVKMVYTCRYFKLEPNTNFIIDPFTFSNDVGTLQKEYLSPEFLKMIGEVRNLTAFKNTSFGFCTIESNNLLTEEKLIEWLHAISYKIKYWWFFLWFAKDTNASLDELIAYVPDNHGCAITESAIKYKRADHSKQPTFFSLSDLRKTDTIIKKYTELMKDRRKLTLEDYKISAPVNKQSGIYISQSTSTPYNENSRLERAIIFLRFACQAEFMPMKIALYIPVLESLFSNDNLEVKHKVSERCANYIGGSKKEKLENFQTIRHAYDIRSNLLHGAKLSKNTKDKEKDHNSLETQINLSKRIDELVRVMLTKVILKDGVFFTDEKADVVPFYDTLIFS
jgi:hypothetical protein